MTKVILYVSLLTAYLFQTTASEATFVSLLAARSEAIKRCQIQDSSLENTEINGRLVAYCSDQVRYRGQRCILRIIFSVGNTNLEN